MIFDDRTSACSTELVFDAKWRLRSSGTFVIVASRIQRIVVVKPKGGSMELVRAALGDYIHDGSGIAAVFRGKLVCNEAHFLDNIRIVDSLLPAAHAGVLTAIMVSGREPEWNRHAGGTTNNIRLPGAVSVPRPRYNAALDRMSDTHRNDRVTPRRGEGKQDGVLSVDRDSGGNDVRRHTGDDACR